MGYLSIPNLYRPEAQAILAFRTVFASEKIHGTSASVGWNKGAVTFFSGGENCERFKALFDEATLTAKFAERFTVDDKVIVYGEAYGGKQQGMSATYGKDLKFIAFDVRIGDRWLAVPQAAELIGHLGLEFVDYAEVSTDIAALDAERDKPSTQAVRNGITETKIREGIVLRPPFEVTLNNGARLIAKHKRAEFAERGRPNVELDPTKREVLEQAEAIAAEWVTPRRLEHVMDQIKATRGDGRDLAIEDTATVIRTMVEDVIREASGEIVDSKEARKAIGSATVKMFKRLVTAI